MEKRMSNITLKNFDPYEIEVMLSLYEAKNRELLVSECNTEWGEKSIDQMQDDGLIWIGGGLVHLEIIGYTIIDLALKNEQLMTQVKELTLKLESTK